MTATMMIVAAVLVVAALLMLASLFLPDFEVYHFESALTAAAISYFLGAAAGFAINVVVVASSVLSPSSDPSPSPVADIGWLGYVGRPVLSSVTLALGITFTPTIRASVSSTIIAAVVVSAIVTALMAGIAPLLVPEVVRATGGPKQRALRGLAVATIPLRGLRG